MRRIDMHAHLFCLSESASALEEVKFRRQQGIFTCFSAGTMEEWQFMKPIRNEKGVLCSFGIHPWYADRYDVGECMGAFQSCDYVGEIGMDSVWCQVSLKRQRQILEQQLELAVDLNKPVLLHTKGQEKEIGELIRDFPGKICVHWYSGKERDLEIYLEKDCYFTLGPDYAQNPVLKEVPVHRLFLETDGLSAIAWAKGVETFPLQMIAKTLEENEAFLAKERQMTEWELQERMKKNLLEFLGSFT